MARVRSCQDGVSRDCRWSRPWLAERSRRAAALTVAGMLLVALATLGGGGSTGAVKSGHLYLAASIHHQPVRHVQRKSPAPPQLVFGVYPGGAAGTVGPSGRVAPENPVLRMAALQRLRPSRRPFILHLYASYTGVAGASAAQQVGDEIREYGHAGFQTELVMAYRPGDGGSPGDVGGFVEFVQMAIRSLGRTPGFVSLQVTNEANQGGSPNTSDGYYAGAKDALIDGVIAAKAEIRKHALGHVKVGFNWLRTAIGHPDTSQGARHG